MSRLDQLPPDAVVLDVGGGAAHDARADWVIDLTSWERRNWFYTDRGEVAPAQERIPRDHWVQRDICNREPWPFADGQFDFVLCSQTLEDVRDPIWVCHEMMRVGRAGLITTPAAITELTRGIESPYWCGWRHHRWLVEKEPGGLVFVGKPHSVNDPTWAPAVRSPRLLRPGALDSLSFTWEGQFTAREEILVESSDLESRLRGVIAAASRPDPVGAASVIVRTVAGTGYRGARRVAGRLARAAALRRGR